MKYRLNLHQSNHRNNRIQSPIVHHLYQVRRGTDRVWEPPRKVAELPNINRLAACLDSTSTIHLAYTTKKDGTVWHRPEGNEAERVGDVQGASEVAVGADTEGGLVILATAPGIDSVGVEQT